MDSNYCQIHMNQPRVVLFASEWRKDKLPIDDVEVRLEYLPPMPEDELTIQHSSANLILMRSKQLRHEPAWKDMALDDLVDQFAFVQGSQSQTEEVSEGNQKKNLFHPIPMASFLQANRKHQGEHASIRYIR
ncbi:anaphase-promoting complex subunit Apc13 [Schizosaccharomyces cryophilus OY26]|uniref:Anaphase-promoting complex subunit Apc13 n=1 Tax=Schizosaccharomyces cryophilus (strain OY26 / ATCC MYA-4695 / CBS 11777 / NBRC 106824 / NRRL Y48691) TaxID=653667 RepID=S9W2X8_SCHCR|nr:anaphase-promoting complex subunit Apc13 [Schizosaccharomyces cryophilus OY26]EPY52914.1 anaphase-promoting complex subunit Apc13 [Schizosaccharomyces cryophilus OY26]